MVHCYGIFLEYHGTHTDNLCIDDHNIYSIMIFDHPYSPTTCMEICMLYDQHFCRTLEIGHTYCQGSKDTLGTAGSDVVWNCGNYDFWERSVLRNAGQCMQRSKCKLYSLTRYTVGEQKRFLSSRKILSIVIMWYWLQCCSVVTL